MTDFTNNNNNNHSGAGRVKSGNNKKLSSTERAAYKALKKAKQLMRQAKRDRKNERNTVLSSHGLIETLGGVAQRAKDTPGYIDQAMKMADAVEQLKDTLRYKGSKSNDLIENVICRFEDLISLIICLMNTKNYAGFMATIHLYIRTHYTKSTSKFILSKVTEMFSSTTSATQEKLHSHSKETTASGFTTLSSREMSPEERVAEFRRCMSDWKTLRHGAFARHACQFVNILTTFGWLDLADKPIAIGTFELFRARVWDVQKNSLDFMDVIIDTFGFFLERGYLAFAKGDISLLMYSDSEAAAFEQEYSLLVACDSLMETGRLEDLKTEKIKGESDFESRLENLIVKCYSAIQAEKNPQAKTVYTNRLVVLKKLRSKLIMLQKQSPVRTKPYGVSIFGGSAVGKTIINSIVTKVLLTANGFESSKQHVVTLNDSDPYQSEFRTFHNAVTMDDFGNTKADRYETSPTAKIIDFLNNVPKAALSPIAELKGNVMIRPKLVCVTTNVKKLLANVFSNEPVSILRRFEVHLDVRLRDEWVDPETGGINASMIGDTFIPDAWCIDLQRVKIIRTENPESADEFAFDTILKDASIFQVLDWMRTDSAAFYSRQTSFVESVEKFYELELCPHYNHPKQCLQCTKLEEQAVEEELFIMDQNEELIGVEDPTEYIPMENAVQQWYRNTGVDYAVHSVKTNCKNLKDAFEYHKEAVLHGVERGFAAFGLLYTAMLVFQSLRRASNTLTGNHSREDGIPEVLPEDHESNWSKIEYVSLPKTHRAASRVSSEFEEMVKKHLAYCSIFNYEKNKVRSSNIWPVSGNTWLLPGHMIDVGSNVEIQVQTGRSDSVMRRFTERIDESKIQRFGDDYLLIRLVKGGPVPNTLDMLVAEDYKFIPEPMKFVVKNQDGIVNRCVTRAIECKEFATAAGKLKGFSYNIAGPTAEGMCIAPVYTYRSPHVIVGFHLAGHTGTPYGVAGCITASAVEEALTLLNKKNNLYCHSQGDFTPSKYGRDFTPKSDIPKDHAVHRLGNDADGQGPCAEIYGAHDLGRSFFRTQVRKSPISDSVKRIMNIERTHGPPKRDNIGQHWERDLNLMAHPKGTFVPKTWMSARRDYLSKVEKFCEAHPKMLSVTHPLAHDYVMAGADGIAAFSRIPLSTSMGWPLNKAKKLFISTVDREVPGVSEPIDFEDPMFLEEIERIKETLAQGERIHTVFRGNLKDEPTKWTKNKIRVFAGCEVAFTCVVREFYLPIVRLIQNNWKEFECAVGINAHGPQWNELTEHIIKHGRDRIIAGDYAAFDKSASPEAMMSAFDILMHIAQLCGYTERELNIMRGIATEISYPIYELDGVIVQLFGSNPSGHPLTVIVNNLMNSLYMRYAYYILHEGDSNVKPFDMVVSLMCYGDDNIMSVSADEKNFNMLAISEILADVGIKYTKADKTAITESDLYQDLSEVEFLKRAFIYNPMFGCWTAALELTSIGKSLHNQMVSSTPREEIAAQAIRSANTEFAYHGTDVFNMRQPQLYAVAQECGLEGLVGELPTLDEIVERHSQSNLPKPMVEEPLLSTQGLESYINAVDQFEAEAEDIVRSYEDDASSVLSDSIVHTNQPPREIVRSNPIRSSEETLTDVCVQYFGMRPYKRNVPIISTDFGEVDLIFRVMSKSGPCFVEVEVKSVVGRCQTRTKRLNEVRSQARKYGRVLAVLRPEPVISLIYTEIGFEVVFVATRSFMQHENLRDHLINVLLFDIGEFEPDL